jgi:hypothetical protein
VKSFAVSWLADAVASAVASGTDPAKATVKTTKSVLVRPFCAWLDQALQHMSGDRAAIDRGWQESGFFFLFV